MIIVNHMPRSRNSATPLLQCICVALALLAMSAPPARTQVTAQPSAISRLAGTAGGAALGGFSGVTMGMIYDTIECRRRDRDPLFGCLIDMHHGAKVGLVLGSVAGAAITADAFTRGAVTCDKAQRRWLAWLAASLGAAPAALWLSRSPHWTSERYNRLAMLTPLIQAGTTSLLLSSCH